MGRDRVLDLLRRPAAARWPDGRPARPSAALHDGARDLHGLLSAGRPRLVGGVTDRVPGAARTWRGSALTRSALDPDDDLRGRPGPEPGSRHLGRGLRQRWGGRGAARRRAHELAQLVVDLLHQRAGWRARAGRRPAPRERKSGGGDAPSLRCARCRSDHGRPHAVGVRDDPRGPARLGHASRRSVCSRPRLCSSSRSS